MQMHVIRQLWTWCDSRLSGSHKNKFVTMVLAKSRKRDIHIAYTTQYFKAVDIRIRTVTDFVAIPQLNSKETLCTLKIYSNPAMVLQQVYRFRTQPLWSLYDTHEEVEELDIQEFLDSQKKTRKKHASEDDDEPDDSPIRKKKKKPKPIIYEEDE